MFSWTGPFVEQMCLHPIYDWIPISEASSTLSTWIRYSAYFNELFTWFALILTSASCARPKKSALSKNRYPKIWWIIKFLCCMAITEVNKVNLNAHSQTDILWYFPILVAINISNSHEIPIFVDTSCHMLRPKSRTIGNFTGNPYSWWWKTHVSFPVLRFSRLYKPFHEKILRWATCSWRIPSTLPSLGWSPCAPPWRRYAWNRYPRNPQDGFDGFLGSHWFSWSTGIDGRNTHYDCYHLLPGLVNVSKKTNWKDPPFY